MDEKQAQAVIDMIHELWDAMRYLSQEVLTCHQAEKFSEYVNRNKKKEAGSSAEVIFKKFTEKFNKKEPTKEDE